MEKLSDNDVLYLDNHIIIINKKPGQLTQGDHTGDKPLPELVKDWIKHKFDKPGDVFLGVVHRLDRPVGGVVIFARTSKGLSRMNELIKKGGIQKTYWAIVKDPPPEDKGTLKHYLRKQAKNNKSYANDKPVEGGKYAELDYELLAHSDNYFLLQINLKTGRHHQIRSQLSKMGCPIKGDLKYGFDRTNKDGSIDLIARNIQFTHPVSKLPINISAPLPNNPLWKSFEHLT